ncbi:MAG: serine--tRNA ligase [Acidimicrobiales bacterium]|nr:serine--tRNA ligase [Acidimicrobiales bacterium]
MIDIRLLRSDPESTIAALSKRGIDRAELEAIIELDKKQRELNIQADQARAKIKQLSGEVAKLKREGRDEEAQALQSQSRELGEVASQLIAQADKAASATRQALLVTPNIPAPECPVGKDEKDNVLVRSWTPSDFDAWRDFQRVPHWEIGSELNILDLESGAKLSGSMFPLFRGAGAKLIRALTSFALDAHSDAFEEIRPPTFVRSETMRSTGHLPKFSDEAYHMERDDLWAIPTAEVPLTSIARDSILKESELPIRMTAVTACFRREAGAAGRDTRGLLRVHEFDKVEILSYATSDQANSIHMELLDRAEKLVQALGLTYRILDLCTGDLGASSRRTFDIEVYAPGCDQWLEVSSVSWFGDYQARRANIRYRKTNGNSIEFVNTLNGSALAWPRIWAAIIESGRQKDGSILLPKCLSPYLGGKLTISSDGLF